METHKRRLNRRTESRESHQIFSKKVRNTETDLDLWKREKRQVPETTMTRDLQNEDERNEIWLN